MMNASSNKRSGSEEEPSRRPYVRPELKRVELALAETLSSGCKLESDSVCVGPPMAAFDGGS